MVRNHSVEIGILNVIVRSFDRVDSRQGVCHYVEFTFDVFDVCSELCYEGQMSCLTRGTVSLASEDSCQGFVICEEGERATF